MGGKIQGASASRRFGPVPVLQTRRDIIAGLGRAPQIHRASSYGSMTGLKPAGTRRRGQEPCDGFRILLLRPGR